MLPKDRARPELQKNTKSLGTTLMPINKWGHIYFQDPKGFLLSILRSNLKRNAQSAGCKVLATFSLALPINLLNLPHPELSRIARQGYDRQLFTKLTFWPRGP